MSGDDHAQEIDSWQALDRAWERIIQGEDPAEQDTLPEDDLELLRQLCDAGKLHNSRHDHQRPSDLDRWSGTCLDDYELLSPIAQGGMGIVYRARQRSLNRPVAVKLLRSGLFASPGEVRRFQSEALAAAKLHHPGIVAIYSVGEAQGLHYYAMELVQGISLAQLHRQRVTSDRQAVLWIKQIAEAVEVAHRHNIIHRDLKPANVLIDEHGQLKVTDFGLSAQMHLGPLAESEASESSSATNRSNSLPERLTLSGEILGTPAYMSPEQIVEDRESIGPATDVYALGVILYELLTGKPPFSAARPIDTLRQVLECEPLSPRLVNASVSRDLATICLKCLEKRPCDRFQSARELIDECDRFLAGKPLKTRPVSWLTRSWRMCQRNPVVTLLCSLCLVLLMGTAVGGWITASRLAKANVAEQQAKKSAEANAKAALQQRSLALQTINQLIDNVESELSRRSELLPLRRELLQSMQGKLSSVLDSGNNLDRDASVARAHARLANLYWLSGDAQAAQDHLATALTMIEPLAQDDDREALACYAYVLDELGNQHQMNHRLDEAEQHYKRSLAVLERLLKLSSASNRDRENAAFAHSRLGDVALLKGQVNDARTAYQSALVALVPLIESKANDRRIWRLATRCHERVSWTLSALQELEQASQELDTALQFNQQLLDQDAADQSAKADRCNLLYSQADLKMRQSKLADGRALAQACVDEGEALILADSQNMELRWSHALHCEQLAKLQRSLGEFEAAARSTGRAYDVLNEASRSSATGSQKFLQSLVSVAINGLQIHMRLGDQAAMRLWAQRVIDSVKLLNPPPAEAAIWQVAIDLARDSESGLDGFDADWQPKPELEKLSPAARANGMCVAAYQLIRRGQIDQAVPMLRRAAEYEPENPALLYSQATCQALNWGMIAHALKDSEQRDKHDHAVNQAIANIRLALRANPAGRPELKLCPELEYISQLQPSW